MKRAVVWAAAAVTAFGLMAAPALAEVKLGVVNGAKLLQGSPQYAAMRARLEAEFGPRQKEIVALQTALKTRTDKLQKDGATMSTEQRTRAEKEITDGTRDYQQKASNFQDDVNNSQEQELQSVQQELGLAIANYAREYKFDLVLSDGIAYASTAIDVTDAVLATLKAKPVTAPAAPAAAK